VRRNARRRSTRRRSSRRRVSRNRRSSRRRTSRRKRFILRVKPYHRKETNGWGVVRSGRKTPLSFHKKKSVAVKRARSKAKAQWRKGRKAQIVVYKRNGRIQYEATYGADPRRYKD
jgi:hypothetical protein